MPQVASDPVVSRPLRPESLSGRTGAAAGEASGTFEGLLSGAQTETSDAAATAKPADEATGKSPANPADVSGKQDVKIALFGQIADATTTVPQAIEAAPAGIPMLLEVLAAAPAAALVEAKPGTADADPAAPTESSAQKSSDDTDVIAVADATAADVTTAPVVAAVAPAPAPAPANPPSVSGPTADVLGIAPVQAPAGSAPADAAAADTEPQPAAAPAIASGDNAAPAKPQVTSAATPVAPIGKTTSADEAQKTATPKTAGLSEAPEANESPARPSRKNDAGKTSAADHSGGAARTTGAQPHAEVLNSAADAEQLPKAAPHQPRSEAAEHAPLIARTGAAEARPELPAAAAPQAQIHAGGALPFGLAVHAASSLAAFSPLTALRLDTADVAVPVAGLAVEIVSRAQDGLRRFDIRLDPPELGRIDVRLDVDAAGKVTSRLTVERVETLDLLRRDAPQLERALQHAGLNTEGGLEFSLRDQNFANREQTPREAPTRLIVPDDEAIAAEAARRGYGRMIGLGGGVDIRV